MRSGPFWKPIISIPWRVIDAAGELLPFGDASFDVVYSNNVLEHTSKPAQVLREGSACPKAGRHIVCGGSQLPLVL